MYRLACSTLMFHFCAAVAAAGTITIDFDQFPDGSVIPNGTEITNQYAPFGASFSSLGGGAFATFDVGVSPGQASSAPNFLIGTSSGGGASPFAPIIMNLVNPTKRVDFTLISVGLSTVRATAFASDLTTVLDFEERNHPERGVAPGPGDFDFVSLEGNEISRDVFEITNLNVTDGYGVDDISFAPIVKSKPVPEPSSITLICVGLASLLCAAVRTRRNLGAHDHE